MNWPKLPLASLVLAAPLAACVSMGTNYDPVAVERLQPGMTTAQVIAMLGKPTARVRRSDGRQNLSWLHSRGTMLGHGASRMVILTFDAQGKYTGELTQSEAEVR